VVSIEVGSAQAQLQVSWQTGIRFDVHRAGRAVAGFARREQHALRERGLLVKAIRPPTVPEGTSRLRLAVTALHTSDDIARLVEAVRALGQHPLPPQTLANGPSR
jgi:7-keto-8-aminopelargonate synthetase-like enzyme